MASQFPVAALEVLGYLPLVLTILLLSRRAWQTTLWVYFITLMFMVERAKIDLPMIPPIGKQEYASLACFFAIMVKLRPRLKVVKTLRGPEAAMFILWFGAIGTWLTNRETLSYGIREPTVLAPLALYDVPSMVLRDAFNVLLPFFVGRTLVQSEDDMRQMLTTLVKATLVYSLFCWVESILSPQLHKWIYGFHQHDFIQCKRAGGWRPMVFMEHGLAVANFMLAGAIAAFTLARARLRVWKIPGQQVQAYSAIALLNMKSTGAIMFGLMTLPVVLTRPAKTQLALAMVLMSICVAYPTLKITGYFPDKQIVELTKSLSKERAQSVQFRFDNDVALLAKSREKLLFGWGGGGRNVIYNMYGLDVTVIDGWWVGQLSTRGLFGLVGSMIMMLMPAYLAYKRARRIASPQLQLYMASLALLTTCAVLDLMPNGLYNTMPFFFAGALYGALTGTLGPRGRNPVVAPMQPQRAVPR